MEHQLSFTASTHQLEWRDRDRTKSRLHVFIEGESILENLENRRSRPYTEFKKLLAPIFKMLGVAKARWSQKAGCSCGCSPGFILDRLVMINPDDQAASDVFVTIKGVAKNDGTHRELFDEADVVVPDVLDLERKLNEGFGV